MTTKIPDELIDQLLASDAPRSYPTIEQFGPLRHHDREMRCTSRRCGSSTYLKLQGVPYCMTHCLVRMNEMLIDRDVNQ